MANAADPHPDHVAADPALLARLQLLEPLSRLSARTLSELAGLCQLEHVARGALAARHGGGRGLYLLSGELHLTYADGSSSVLVGGSEAALLPLGPRAAEVASARAINDVELLRVDGDLVDVLLTWEQLGVAAMSGGAAELPAGLRAHLLAQGPLAALPAANVQALLRRFVRVDVVRAQVVVRENDEGDFYYVIESGRARVTRRVAGAEVEVAELARGMAFGEEALVADTTRNATVTMITDGALLRLPKSDFVELLREPLLNRVTRREADAMASAGAVWLDVRFPAEFHSDGIAGAMNIPLNEIRNAFDTLDRGRPFIVYCQSGRRSAAAAFLLAQRGFRAYLLDGGLRGV